MPKPCRTHRSTMEPSERHHWTVVEGSHGLVEACTLAIDAVSGDYIRLTRFLPGADSTAAPAKSHDYPEEIYIVSGSLYDVAFQRWLRAGDYASRPPFELHGGFRTDEGCLVLEVSFPSQGRRGADDMATRHPSD